MTRYFIKLSYKGNNYHGWQAQPQENAMTIQTTLARAFKILLRDEIEIVGCGRTDTGVHAINYVAHFDSFIPFIAPDLVYKLNKILPQDIAIHEIIEVAQDAHARFDAISRSYTYQLHTSKTPFCERSFYYTYDIPDIDRLNQASQLIVGFTDFTTFCKLPTDTKTKICRVQESYWTVHNQSYVYKIKADRFLRGMIRLIVGMCLNVDRGKLTLEEVQYALENQKRLKLDWSVPAVGLTLCDIKYPYIG